MFKKIVLAPIFFYQKFISPLFPRTCRYYPTCSQYTVDAIRVHGVFKGLLMGIVRICRCNPFVKGGIDYVPVHFSLHRNMDKEYHGPYTKEHIEHYLKEHEHEQEK